MNRLPHRNYAIKNRRTRGFTLIEMMIVIAIIVIISTIGIVVYTGVTKQTRDSVRIADLTSLYQAITSVMQESNPLNASILCVGSGTYPCFGTTYPTTSTTRNVDGTGWVHVNLVSPQNLMLKTLPVDPLNNSAYHYVYCANNDNFEINAVLEADTQQKMVNDGGDDANKYEVGTDLTLVGNVAGCIY